MTISNDTKKIRSIAICGCMLSLSIIISFITNFIKVTFLGDFLTLDLSLLFIIPLIYILDYKWSLLVGILSALFSFLWSAGLWIGPIFNIIYNISIIILIQILEKILFKKIKNISMRIILTMIFALIFISLWATILNALIFQPLYWWVFGYINAPSFIEAEKVYNLSPNIFLLYINNYWLGVFYIYMIFNILKLGILFVLLYSPIYLLIKYSWAEKYLLKEKKECK